jgi:hypothetical protein
VDGLYMLFKLLTLCPSTVEMRLAFPDWIRFAQKLKHHLER